MDFTYTVEQTSLRRTARDFARDEVQPLIPELERDKRMPRRLIERMKELGFYAVQYPEQYGGAGSTYVDYAIVIEELARVYCSVAAQVSVSNLCTGVIYNFGTEEQKRRYLPELLTGNAIGSFAFTEAATGSDPGAIATTCVRDGDYWVISGEKLFVTNSTMPGYITVFCKDVDHGGKVTNVIVPKDTPGYSVSKVVEKMGMHGLEVADVRLDNVRVPLANAVGGEEGRGKGFAILTTVISEGKLGISAQCVGMAQAALEEAVRYAGQRTQRGKPILAFPTIQSLLGEMAAEVEAARLMTLSTAWKRSQGQPIVNASARTRLFVSQVAHRAASNAMQVFGAYGYTKEFAVERIFRDMKLAEIYEGVNEIQRLIAAADLAAP